jgi:glycolate oxidase FAD binding subunit
VVLDSGERLAPATEADLATVILDSAAAGRPLAVAGSGSKAGLGRPTQTAATLTTTSLTGITLYEPAELVVSARAGTPLAEIENVLAKNNQRLSFEPPDYRSLYGSAGEPTIGSVAAVNLSGPRRIQAGAARDSLIGIRAVTGRGDIVKSGGRVMKNVTGLDLVKFLAGSYGTLAVFSEVTFKVLPAPETEATLVLSGLDDATAVVALSAALGSPWGITGAAHKPATGGERGRTYIRLDGFDLSVTDRFDKLSRALGNFGLPDRIDAEASQALWRDIRDLHAFAAAPDEALWRVSVRPSDGPRVAKAVSSDLDCSVLYDWGGGLVWLSCAVGADAGGAIVRSAVRAVGGHATLVRAPAAVRNSAEVFDPPEPAVMMLTKRLKETLDPSGILNPGRMYPGV